MQLPTDQPTIAHHLNKAGYRTHYIGKWHLSGEPQRNRWVPPNQRGGFQHFIGWESHHIDHNDGLIWYDNPDSPRKLRGHETDGLADIVCEELEALTSTETPFFMAVSFQAPHAPCSPPELDKQRYDHSVIDYPPNTQPDSWFQNANWNADYGVEEFRKRYFGEISHLDAAFGRILDTLQKTGLAENTVVIFTSDHGDMAGCHGRFGKGVMFDESVRVPLLVRLPEIKPRTVDSLASTVDLFSTILEMAGVEAQPDSEGRSLLPCINGQSHATTDVFIEYDHDCLVRGDLKLVTKRNESDITHCFDLANDPYELNNLAAKLNHQTRLGLLGCLIEWRNRIRQ